MFRLVLLGDGLSGVVLLTNTFHDRLCSLCFMSICCLILPLSIATVRLMSGGASSASRCLVSILVDLRPPVMIRQQSCKADSRSAA